MHMKSAYLSSGQKSSDTWLPVWAMLAAFTCIMLTGNFAAAQSDTAAKKAPAAKLETMNPKNFDRSTIVENKWMPMKPGTRWLYEGTTVEDDGKVVPHRLEINITDLTKVIGGVRNVVSYDLDYVDNELVEAELAFFAQDNEGTVWHFGEYPEEYEDGKLIKAPTWIHGFESARAGIVMMARPQLGTPSYAQGWGPAVGWSDRGQVYLMGEKTTVRAGKYEDVLVIKETSKQEVDSFQLKYYAAGVGNVRVGWGGKKDKSKETLELVKVEQLGPKEMAELREKALKLEKSAYKVSKKVYARTTPMEVPK
jgi:hypothetical protein